MTEFESNSLKPIIFTFFCFSLVVSVFWWCKVYPKTMLMPGEVASLADFVESKNWASCGMVVGPIKTVNDLRELSMESVNNNLPGLRAMDVYAIEGKWARCEENAMEASQNSAMIVKQQKAIWQGKGL